MNTDNANYLLRAAAAFEESCGHFRRSADTLREAAAGMNREVGHAVQALQSANEFAEHAGGLADFIGQLGETDAEQELKAVWEDLRGLPGELLKGLLSPLEGLRTAPERMVLGAPPPLPDDINVLRRFDPSLPEFSAYMPPALQPRLVVGAKVPFSGKSTLGASTSLQAFATGASSLLPNLTGFDLGSLTQYPTSLLNLPTLFNWRS